MIRISNSSFEALSNKFLKNLFYNERAKGEDCPKRRANSFPVK